MGNDVDICHILWDTQRFALDFCEISTELVFTTKLT